MNKKIMALFTMLILVLSTFSAFAVSEDDDSGNTDVEEIEDEDLDEAKEQGTIARCVNFLKNKYPRVRPAKFREICKNLDDKMENEDLASGQAKNMLKIENDRFKNFAKLNQNQKERLMKFNEKAKDKLANLREDHI